MKRPVYAKIYIVLLIVSVFVSCKKDDEGSNSNTKIDCSKANLVVSANVTENRVTASVTGGASPYLYALDDNSNYVSSNVFETVQMGEHIVYVKDANGCTDTTKVNIEVFTDNRDNQAYKVVTIGTQTWLAENLNYAVPDSSFCYANSADSCAKYGRLYKLGAAKIACPEGWHLPSDDEWKTLEMYLGMSQSEADGNSYRGTDEGTKLKAGGTSGFNALLSGYSSNGLFTRVGTKTYFWTSTKVSESSNTYYRSLEIDETGVFRGGNPGNNGLCVRCIKD